MGRRCRLGMGRWARRWPLLWLSLFSGRWSEEAGALSSPSFAFYAEAPPDWLANRGQECDGLVEDEEMEANNFCGLVRLKKLKLFKIIMKVVLQTLRGLYLSLIEES